MKKYIALIVLVIVSAGILFLFGITREQYPTEYYFRENETLSGKIALPQNTTWKKFSDEQEEQMVHDMSIPVLSGFDSFSCWSRYADGELCEIQLDWTHTVQEEYQSVVLYLFPETPGKYEKVDGMYHLDYDTVTETERDGIVIYGDGTVESRSRVLEMELGNGLYCQIVNACAVNVLPSEDSLEAVGILVDFVLEHGGELKNLFDLEEA